MKHHTWQKQIFCLFICLLDKGQFTQLLNIFFFLLILVFAFPKGEGTLEGWPHALIAVGEDIGPVELGGQVEG